MPRKKGILDRILSKKKSRVKIKIVRVPRKERKLSLKQIGARLRKRRDKK